jgi:hypothetical protein
MSRQTSRTCIGALAVTAVVVAAFLSVRAAAAPRPAPAVTLELLDGRTLSLAEYRGSPVILLFWAPW